MQTLTTGCRTDIDHMIPLLNTGTVCHHHRGKILDIKISGKKFRDTEQIVIATDIKGIWDLLARLYRDPLRPQIFCQLFHRNIAGIDTDTGFLFL